MSGKKSWAVLCLLLVVALSVVSCGQATTEVVVEKETVVVEQKATVLVEKTVEVEKEVEKVVTATPEPVVPADVEQVLRIAVGRDSGVLNPHDYASNFPALTMIYEPLVKYATDGSIQPGLAESWEISDDGLVWTFHLRQGVTFHDGTPFNAEAAKWNLERWIGVERHSWLPSSTKVEAIETPDEYTVVLRMKEFYYPAIQDLTLVRPVRFLSPNAVDAEGNFVSAVGTGAWRVEEYVPEQRTVFVPYEGYWGTKPTLTKVVFEVIPDGQTRIAALLSGEIDLVGGEYIGGISLESLPVLERNPDVQVLKAEGSTSYLIQTNFAKAPFDDLKVRQALNYAIDRQTISTQIFKGLAVPAEGLFAANIPYVTRPHPEYYVYDAEKAKSLLAEAGWTLGADGILEKDGKPFEVSMVVDQTMFPQAKSVAEVVQAELTDIGIKMDVRLLEYGGWSEALQQGDYDLAMDITWGSPYDPHSSLVGLFYTGVVALEGTVYEDPELDALIDAALTTRDEAERQAKYDEIWAFLDENAAAVPVVYSARFYALRNTVQGFNLAGTEYELDLQGVTITAP